jgi:hypothetical protein
MIPPEEQDVLVPVLTGAARVLSTALGRHVRLGDALQLTEEGRRNVVLRCRNLSGGVPSSVIIKKVVMENYSPDDIASWDIRRFLSDWVGAQFVSAIPGDPRYCPRVYGGDYALGFFIVEDLGHHRSLVEPLLEEKADSAEKVLLTFSARLGALHAATIGHAETFEGLFTAISPKVRAQAQDIPGVDERIKQLQACLDRVDVSAGTAATRELEDVFEAIEKPGPFRSFIHGDPCPDNVLLIGDELRLIDFEFCSFGHALMDGSYGRMMFPTCWCANRLPDALVSQMEAVYRAELVKGCPEAQEDRVFESAIVTACAFWLFSTLSRHLGSALESDRTWGIATMRQRLLARLEAFIRVAEEFNHLPGMRDVADRVHEVLDKLWAGTDPLPLYPAFRKAPCD